MLLTLMLPEAVPSDRSPPKPEGEGNISTLTIPFDQYLDRLTR
ncbi:hypothetical protein [Nostoc sp.]